MRIHFTSIVARGHVDRGLINETNDLNVVGGFQPLETSDGVSGNETGSVTSLSTPGHHLSFKVCDGGVWLRRGPKTEV